MAPGALEDVVTMEASSPAEREVSAVSGAFA
jgi:hypothetical protein